MILVVFLIGFTTTDIKSAEFIGFNLFEISKYENNEISLKNGNYQLGIYYPKNMPKNLINYVRMRSSKASSSYNTNNLNRIPCTSFLINIENLKINEKSQKIGKYNTMNYNTCNLDGLFQYERDLMTQKNENFKNENIGLLFSFLSALPLDHPLSIQRIEDLLSSYCSMNTLGSLPLSLERKYFDTPVPSKYQFKVHFLANTDLINSNYACTLHKISESELNLDKYLIYNNINFENSTQKILKFINHPQSHSYRPINMAQSTSQNHHKNLLFISIFKMIRNGNQTQFFPQGYSILPLVSQSQEFLEGVFQVPVFEHPIDYSVFQQFQT